MLEQPITLTNWGLVLTSLAKELTQKIGQMGVIYVAPRLRNINRHHNLTQTFLVPPFKKGRVAATCRGD